MKAAVLLLVWTLYASFSMRYMVNKATLSCSADRTNLNYLLSCSGMTANFFAMSPGIGIMAPDFAETDSSGRFIQLSSYSCKYVLLNFGASWCAPFRRANENLLKVYSDFHLKGLEILRVSIDKPSGQNNWIKAINDDGLIWAQVKNFKCWENDVAILYGVKSFTSNFLIDPSWKIVAKNLKGNDLYSQIHEIYGNHK